MARPDPRSSPSLGPCTGRSEALSHGVRVSVSTQFVPERSSAMARDYLFAYEITITNEGDDVVRLLTRRWLITDAVGHTEEVEGVGVIGETPILAPGERHVYTSYCPLHTEFGTMEGSYGMVRPDGTTFRARVAQFSLAVPTAIN